MLFFFNDTATTEIYTYCHTLSLHDALPICADGHPCCQVPARSPQRRSRPRGSPCARATAARRSEEHTSELQSLMRISYAVFCLKKKTHIKQFLSHCTLSSVR